ncbi:beta-galactosidase/beta-glucuronidase [Terriglobus roseus DSM 18391]|uniref:Beta-galactosidase/beta-glucuronidase n=1 Tax=Terriglobus roseus (strain DSM 18391 / NRRL B-41598 / KBS 63) TaxID=926566 RepID=I3ZJ53_TERRK|nr:glycosyl hydrolase family 2 [Terriglobus roseus]AFL89271.1 beta-galactosidase/beta-glucuronidase [Terriglobus roseus DSM 18391]
MTSRRLLSALVLLLFGTQIGYAARPAFHDGWQLHTACGLAADGAALSDGTAQIQDWTTVTLPSTVLAAQVAAKQLPDPYFADNLRKLPGMGYAVGENFSNFPMPADSPYRCGWWYRKSFHATVTKGERTILHFGGINYRGELWVNGHRIAGSDEIEGAYRAYDFDISNVVRPAAENIVAVQVFAPTENDLGINWVDWNPAPPDKDMGLWGDVALVTTGAVTLRSPMVTTHFTDETLQTAELTIYAEAANMTDAPIEAVLRGTLVGQRIEQKVSLAAHEQRTVTYPIVRAKHPELWWPKQMGEPHLEKLSLTAVVAGRQVDSKEIDFGIREMSSELTANGSRLFRVNGKPILIRGAGWSQDMMLRSDDDKLRDQIEMVQHLNLNTIRLEGKLETEEFFHMTDKNGLLVMLGWCCCDRWEQWSKWTDKNLSVATSSLHDQLLRLRSHASLLVWLNGSDNAPPEKVERAYLDVEAAAHWPNPILSAASSQTTSLTGLNGVKMSGPYDYVEPSYWYVDHKYGGAFGFNTETSPGPAIPSLASRKLFLTDPEAWPATNNWKLHFGGNEFSKLDVMDQAMAAIYAKPTSAESYERMAHTMQYDSERAMFESYSRNKYQSTGVVQWMLNNAWPSMIWHLYDYYLDADAGYFATKKACEPLHIQYGYDDRSVAVVNSTYAASSDLKASISVRDLSWHELYRKDQTLTLAADGVQQVTVIPENLYRNGRKILLLDLSLRKADGTVVSRNFYWVPTTLTAFDWTETNFTHTPAARYEDLSALTTLPTATIDARVTMASGPVRNATVMLHNNSATVAFQVRVAARSSKGELVAPVMWSDNWIEVPPGETTTLTAALPESAPKDVVFQLDGWNVAAATLAVAGQTR